MSLMGVELCELDTSERLGAAMLRCREEHASQAHRVLSPNLTSYGATRDKPLEEN